MAIRALVFDIGGTVFDWNTALIGRLRQILPGARLAEIDPGGFALACRAGFLEINGAVYRRERGWMTAEEILAAAIDRSCTNGGLDDLTAAERRDLRLSWREMPAWPGAREAIARLRRHYIVAPLTILSWPMAVGSSRRAGIDWDSILSCDVIGVYKPDPRCYARAAEIMDRPAGEIMMVASHPSDLRAARDAGYRTAYVVAQLEDPGDSYADSGFAAEFDIVARDFAELAARLAPEG